jgi:hypothetical protein
MRSSAGMPPISTETLPLAYRYAGKSLVSIAITVSLRTILNNIG